MSSNYKNILLALDGSEGADKAFNKSLEIAKRNEATLILTHIVDTRILAPIAEYDNEIINVAEARGKEILATYEKKAYEANIANVKILLKRGLPKLVITKELVPKEKIDLIIMGATGINAVERFLIGSVTENVVRHATCDVLIVR